MLSLYDPGSGSVVSMSRTESAAAGIIGKRIKQERLAVRATRLDLAYHAKVDPTNLGRYETGKALPNLATLVRIAETLGLDPGTLIAGLNSADFPQDREAPQPLPTRVPHTSSTG